MSVIVVELHISAEEYLRMYAGSARDVITYAVDGRRVRFPANILRPFVTRSGVRGRFRISFTPDNRFEGIERLG